MEKADGLSRRLNWKVGIENKNSTAKGKGKKIVRVVKEMKKVGVKVLRGNEWQIDKELVLKERNVYILKDEELRVEIIWLYHNMLTAGYRGRWKIIELMT